jgi:hypothetical protein
MPELTVAGTGMSGHWWGTAGVPKKAGMSKRESGCVEALTQGSASRPPEACLDAVPASSTSVCFPGAERRSARTRPAGPGAACERGWAKVGGAYKM